MSAAENPRAVIGDNQPPEPTPRESFAGHVGDLMVEARQHLDGAEVTTQAQADAIGKLLDMCRQSAKDAEKQRKVEKQPHADAAKAVDAAWNPLIAQCEAAASVAKKALAPFLAAEQARRDAEAAERRREAERIAAEAREAARVASAAADLERREEAERLLKEAEKAGKIADRAEKAKASATGGARAVTLRDVWTAELTDPRATLNHYAATRRDALCAWLLAEAQADVRAGSRSIPGITIKHERIAQ